MDLTGKTFGQYRIVRLLGRGGMGEVYDVVHRVLERRYALKLLPQDFAGRAEAVRRFEREAKVMANLEHPHIVRVDEFGETGGRYWLRMELVRGVETGLKAESGKQKTEISSVGTRCITLGDYAAQEGGRIKQDEFAVILRQVLEALAYAHEKGVVHRDLKPGNILLEMDAQGQLLVKVSDFGLARVIGEEVIRSQAQISVSRSLSMGAGKTVGEAGSIGDAKTLGDEGTSTRALLGTWEYMSPEQRRGEEADARSDVYALGLMCFRLLTGEELGMRTPSRIVSGLSVEWDPFLEKALEQKPGVRYGSGREMLDASVQVIRAMEVAREAARQEDLCRAEAERRRQEAEAARQREAALAKQAQEEERQREEARRSEQERQKAEAEQVEAERRRQAGEAQAAPRSRQRAAPQRRWLWAMGMVGVAVVCVAAWYWGIRVPAQQRQQARREQESRKPRATPQVAGQRQREDLAGATASLEAGKKVRQAPPPASSDNPWVNSLGMKFVPVAGTKVLFSVWDVRVKDFRAFARDGAGNGGWDYPKGTEPYVLQSDGWKQRGWQYGWGHPGFPQTDEHPVTCVSWEDAQAFCRWLTQKERAEGKIGPEQSYRLPTDVEWSVAVGLPRESGAAPKDKDAKIKDVYPWGTGWPPPAGAGNYAGDEAKDGDWPANWGTIEGYRDSYPRTSPAGSFRANGYGLYDMGGNVWQWCEDWYGTNQTSRVLRGASWGSRDPDLLLSSYRIYITPDFRYDLFGFRCVLVVGSSP